MLPGLGGVVRVEMTVGQGGGDSRVPVALRQPSRGLLTQKRCRHGANLPMEEGPGLELRQENRGLKGLQGCDRDTLGCVRILVTVNSAAVNIQFSHSVCLTLWDPTDCSTPGFPVHQQLPSLLQLMSIELVVPSNHLILCRPLLLLPSIFPSIRVFSNESALEVA